MSIAEKQLVCRLYAAMRAESLPVEIRLFAAVALRDYLLLVAAN